MLIRLLERTQTTIGILFLIVFFITIVYQVITRFIGVSAIWTGEVATYSFIWAVFMGASVMLNRREHFQFDLLLKKLKGKGKSSLTLVNDVIILGFSSAITVFGAQAMINFWNYNWVSIPQLKMGYVWIAVPIMGLTMSIYTLNHIIQNLKHFSGKEVQQ
ncbi:TRAP transporter small permease subunit [Halobacillus litoralis]|uniref:TRAP transporter small permease n=1 Tax=Halobacillus litoralis TaxID=45668 RepID=UPI001CD5DA7C|nr:TRAP transporter small permease subunit [Halobacillus litoralis]MCA0972151.1 TRAP transporter small permease subunit [Halobacillus litoralis]